LSPLSARASLLAIALLFSVACVRSPDRPSQLTIFAASSTAEVVTALAARYERRTQIPVRTSFAASSILGQQIIAGAPADLYLSADTAWMDKLQSLGHIDTSSRRDLLGNRLVLVTPIDTPFDAEFKPEFDLLEHFRGPVGIADPAHVPAGRYAKAALEYFRWWRPIASRVIPAQDVRAALRLAERGEVGMAVIYATDAATSKRVHLAGLFPGESHPTIVYPIAKLRTAHPAAGDLLLYLSSPEAWAVYAAAGFTPPEGAGTATISAAKVSASKPGPEPAALRKEEVSALLLSLKVGLLSLFFSLAPATFLAWILARKIFIGKSILDALVHLPLVLPPVATGYLLLLAFGRSGLFGPFLKIIGLELPFTTLGAVLASAVMGFPLLVRGARLAFELVDVRLEEAASTLGASPIHTFFSVTLPLAIPGILTGSILCFARSLGEFGATITFAGNISGETQTLSSAIHTMTQLPDGDTAALRLVVLSVLLSFAALLASELLAKRARALIGARAH
jgi:molybdate transport system permease protein